MLKLYLVDNLTFCEDRYVTEFVKVDYDVSNLYYLLLSHYYLLSYRKTKNCFKHRFGL